MEKKGAQFEEAKVHKIRITLASKDVKSLEKGMSPPVQKPMRWAVCVSFCALICTWARTVRANDRVFMVRLRGQAHEGGRIRGGLQ